MGLLARMTKAAGRAAKNEVKRTVRRSARKAARNVGKRLDQRGKPSTRRKSAVARKSVKQLPKRNQQGGWLW